MEFTYSQVAERQDDGDESSDNDDWFLIAHQSAGVGDIPSLMEAIKHDPSVLEYQDNEGMTPLTHAVAGRQLETMKLLVKMGASINMMDSQGRTPLSVAAYQGWYDGVVFLLRNGARQHLADKTGRLPLHAATYDSDTRTISTLLSNLGIEEVNEQDNEGMTALHWAAFHNRPEHVQLLMLKGSDIYSADIDGKTPLHWASQNGSTQCCCVLVHCQSGGPRLVNIIDSSGKSCVHLAAAAGHSEVLRELAQVQGVHFEAGDPDDRTPLHWAAATGQIKCVQMLLDIKVQPSPRDCMGGTPLDYAKQSNHENVAKILLANGAEYGSMKPDVRETTAANSAKKANNNSGKKAKFGFFFSNLFASKKNKDKGNDDNTKDPENVTEMANQEKTDSESNTNNAQQKDSKVKPVIKTRASRISVLSTEAVGLSTREDSLDEKTAIFTEIEGIQQYTTLDRRKNLPPLNEYHRETNTVSQKSLKSAPPLQRQKQVFTTVPGEHLMHLNMLSPIPPLTVNKLKPSMMRSDGLVLAEETTNSLPHKPINRENSDKTIKHSLKKYSPLPSPVAMRRGHSDPTSDGGKNGNPNVPNVKLRPLGRQMYDVATHVETSSQQILAAQRETGSLHPLRSFSPSGLPGSPIQGATPHGSPKLAPLKVARPKMTGYSYNPPAGRCLSNPSTFHRSGSGDKTEDEDTTDDNPNRPRSKSLQTTSDNKSCQLNDNTVIASGLCHSKSVDPLLLPMSSPSADKPSKKKKKRSKHKRAASMEEMKKGHTAREALKRRPSDDVEIDEFQEPLHLRRETPKGTCVDNAKLSTRPGYLPGKRQEHSPDFGREKLDCDQYNKTTQNTTKQVGLMS
ncbi:uncharacterized protein LOC144446931 [Glandiceps talaboti]